MSLKTEKINNCMQKCLTSFLIHCMFLQWFSPLSFVDLYLQIRFQSFHLCFLKFSFTILNLFSFALLAQISRLGGASSGCVLIGY